MAEKRFSDAELAAELLRADGDAASCWENGNDQQIAEAQRERDIWERFAALDDAAASGYQ